VRNGTLSQPGLAQAAVETFVSGSASIRPKIAVSQTDELPYQQEGGRMGNLLNREAAIWLGSMLVLGFLVFIALGLNDPVSNEDKVITEADPVAEKELEKTLRKLCDLTSETAEIVMRKRQAGVSMKKMMEVTANEALGSIAESLVITAYDSPRYHTKEMQEWSIEEFRDEAYLLCVKEKLGR
jgi:hypothetical protein